MKEISKLRRKEKVTSDLAKRLERNNLLQRAMLKKKGEENAKSQSKIKQLMQLVKKSLTPNKINKKSGYTSPNIAKTHMRTRSTTIANEMLASINSPVRLGVSQSFTDVKSNIEVHAQFKKQMVDKELDSAISFRKTEKKLQSLQKCRNKLVEEQKELISERKRVVDSYFQETGIYDDKSPQYMDDRIQAIDLEVSSIDSEMISLEDIINGMQVDFEGDEGFAVNKVELGYENSLYILKSLEREELESTLAYFLEDIIQLKLNEEEFNSELDKQSRMCANLRQQLIDVQDALYVQSKNEKEEFVSNNSKKEHILVGEISNEYIDNQSAEYHGFKSSDSISEQTIISDTQLNVQSQNEDLRNCKTTSDMNGFHDDVNEEQQQDVSMEESRPKKRYDLFLGGSDVFRRLANAHTQASQAKVIQRSSIDDFNSEKRKSLNDHDFQ
jgi:hypothetical protein